MGTRYTQFTESFQWEFVARESYTAQVVDGGKKYVPIPKHSFLPTGKLLLVGVKTNTLGSSKWVHAGWATAFSLQIPSSTTEFTANVMVANERLRLNAFAVVEIPYGTSPVRLEVAVPAWFRDAMVEIWRYDGEIVET
jgi:hypothetical protein